MKEPSLNKASQNDSAPTTASLSEEYKALRILYQQQKYAEAVQALTELCKKINKTTDMSLAVTLPEVIRQSNPTESDNAMAKTFLAIYKDKPEESASFDYYLFSLESAVETVLKEPKKPIEATLVTEDVSKQPSVEIKSEKSQLAEAIAVVELTPENLLGDKGKLSPETLRDYLGQFKDPMEKLKQIRLLFDTVYDNNKNQYRKSFLFGFTRISKQHIQILQDEAINVVKMNRNNADVKRFVLDISLNGDLFDWSPVRFNANPVARTRLSALDIYSDDHAMTIRQTFARTKGANPFKASNPINAFFRRVFNTNNQFNKVPLRNIVDYLVDKNTPIEHVQHLLEPRGLLSRERNVLKELADNPKELQRFIESCSLEIIKMIAKGDIKIMSKSGDSISIKIESNERARMETIFDELLKVDDKSTMRVELNRVIDKYKSGGYLLEANNSNFKETIDSLRLLVNNNKSLRSNLANDLIYILVMQLEQKSTLLNQYLQRAPTYINSIETALKAGEFNLSPSILDKIPSYGIHKVLNQLGDLSPQKNQELKRLLLEIQRYIKTQPTVDPQKLVQLLNAANEIHNKLSSNYQIVEEIAFDLRNPATSTEVEMKSTKRGTPARPDPVQEKDEMGGRVDTTSKDLDETQKREILKQKEQLALRSKQKPIEETDLPKGFLSKENQEKIIKRSKEINALIQKNLGEYFLQSDLVYQNILSEILKIEPGGQGVSSEEIETVLNRYSERAQNALKDKQRKVHGILKRAKDVLNRDIDNLDAKGLESLIKSIKASLNECNSLKNESGKFALPDLRYAQFQSVEKRLKLLEMGALEKLVEKNLGSETPSPEYQKMLDKAMDQFVEDAKNSPSIVFEEPPKPADQQAAKPPSAESTRQQEDQASKIIGKIEDLLEKDLKLSESRRDEITKEFDQIKTLVDPDLGISPVHYLATLQIIENELNNAVAGSPKKPERPPTWTEKPTTPPDEKLQSNISGESSPSSPTESKKQ